MMSSSPNDNNADNMGGAEQSRIGKQFFRSSEFPLGTQSGGGNDPCRARILPRQMLGIYFQKTCNVRTGLQKVYFLCWSISAFNHAKNQKDCFFAFSNSLLLDSSPTLLLKFPSKLVSILPVTNLEDSKLPICHSLLGI